MLVKLEAARAGGALELVGQFDPEEALRQVGRLAYTHAYFVLDGGEPLLLGEAMVDLRGMVAEQREEEALLVMAEGELEVPFGWGVFDMGDVVA